MRKSKCRTCSPGVFSWRTQKSKIMSEKECLDNELIVNVMKRTPKFKPGSELAKSVNLVDAGWEEEQTEDSDVIKISLRLSSKVCPIAKMDD